MDIKSIVITGCSAIGKTTLAKMLLAKYSNLSLVNSYTTRDKRAEDVNYIHITVEQFLTDLDNGDFADFNEVFPGVFYGSKWQSIIDLSNEGKIPLLVTDHSGAKHYNSILDSLVINLVPSDIEIIRNRILSIRSDNVQERLEGLNNLHINFGKEFIFGESINEVIDNIYLEIEKFLSY